MAMVLATAIACCLATATGLRDLDSQRPYTKLVDIDQTSGSGGCEHGTAKSEVRAAMCLAGNARTLGEADVVDSLRRLLHKLTAEHSCAKETRVDLFAYVTLTGDKKGSQVNATREAVEEALRSLNATAFQAVEIAGEITSENYQEYVVGQECFMRDFWRSLPNFVRGLNQLRHVQQCLLQVIQQEVQQGHAYDTVIVSRPDIIYNDTAGWGRLVFDTAVTGVIHNMYDWFMAMPRAVVNKFFDPDRSMPLTCRQGEFCCGNVQRPEDMFEYITEAHLIKYCPYTKYYCHKNFTTTHRAVFVQAGKLARKIKSSAKFGKAEVEEEDEEPDKESVF